MARSVERYVRGVKDSLLEGYSAAHYPGVGLASLSVVAVALFVRMPKQAHFVE